MPSKAETTETKSPLQSFFLSLATTLNAVLLRARVSNLPLVQIAHCVVVREQRVVVLCIICFARRVRLVCAKAAVPGRLCMPFFLQLFLVLFHPVDTMALLSQMFEGVNLSSPFKYSVRRSEAKYAFCPSFTAS